MPKIIKNGLEYSGVPTEVVTAWPPTGDSVLVDTPEMGNTDISEIGDGTLTGAISAVKNGLTDLSYSKSGLSVDNGTLIGGGYVTVGNIVIVNIRVQATSTPTMITGLPAPAITESGNIVGSTAYDSTNERAAFFYMNSSGTIIFPGALGSTGSYLISLVYIRAH